MAKKKISRAGNPPKYKTPEALKKKIDEYFEYCEAGEDREILTKQGQVITLHEKRIPLITGLALYLGFANRQSLYDYEQNNNGHERYSGTIARARARIEVENLTGGMQGRYESRTNALNLAANFGYAQKKEISGADGQPLVIKLVKFGG